MQNADCGKEKEYIDESQRPEMYKIYTKWQIWEAVLSMIFCIMYVVCIAVTTVLTGQKWMAILHILPAICYIEYNDMRRTH